MTVYTGSHTHSFDGGYPSVSPMPGTEDGQREGTAPDTHGVSDARVVPGQCEKRAGAGESLPQTKNPRGLQGGGAAPAESGRRS